MTSSAAAALRVRRSDARSCARGVLRFDAVMMLRFVFLLLFSSLTVLAEDLPPVFAKWIADQKSMPRDVMCNGRRCAWRAAHPMANESRSNAMNKLVNCAT